MGAAKAWELTVPADDAVLGEELRRHGVQPGQRLQIEVVTPTATEPSVEALPAFFGSFEGSPDLAARSSEILRKEFPDAR